MKDRKPFLITALIILLVGICVVLPIEYRKAILLVDFPYTSLFLGAAVLFGMYGFMGKGIIRGLTTVLLSAVFTAIISFFVFQTSFLSTIIALWFGFPVGLFAGLVFLIMEWVLLRKQIGKLRMLMQIALFLMVIFIVFILFYKVSDWFSEISELFKT